MNKAYEAYQFIEKHPAFVGDNRAGLETFYFVMIPVCKNGYSETDTINIYEDNPRFKEFATDSSDVMFGMVSVDYEKYFGYPWEFHEVRYFFEGGPNRYHKEDKIWINEFHDIRIDSDGASYEEALINLAEKVKEIYGDWSSREEDSNTIVPKHIVENNKLHYPFLVDKNDDLILPFERNPLHMEFDDIQINDLWWELPEIKEHFNT